ncbi:GLPGLI family protein [Pedobacter sp. MC2016-15]|uniref:GLPGLI family protein n=1 Tax=Pedobacter sp. MC2016-15 TaxID=2994473 RepID=UPI002246D461|nr:GLPGLI family protein [Pedobacter sp. MC2016-15]MCX2477593.1 GLPGLI family protein [Pedobacter sp. MC2016-15]
MKKTVFIIVLLVQGISYLGTAQNARFPEQGVIQFERNTNMYAVLQKRFGKSDEDWSSRMIEQYKKANPQFKVLKSTMYFSKDKTLFKPEDDPAPGSSYLTQGPDVNQINTIYADLTTHMQTTRKSVFEDTFLIKDSIRNINWKITSETREVAGYTCRRANAIVMDSIYVVAFYTDQIPVSGGPESFGGLPGMILGLALPHDNVSWFAKSVTDKPVEASIVVPPSKGKPTDIKGFALIMKDVMKNWGDHGKAYLKALML